MVADHLAYRYEVLGMLGRGSFGQVMKCRDHATRTVVAVKVIRNKKRFHTQALVEVDILDRLCSKVRLRAPQYMPPFKFKAGLPLKWTGRNLILAKSVRRSVPR